MSNNRCNLVLPDTSQLKIAHPTPHSLTFWQPLNGGRDTQQHLSISHTRTPNPKKIKSLFPCDI